MGYSLIYTPVLHFDDINGRPLVGGKLYTYAAGTSTPATTYRNKDGSETNTNPILLNERGECVVWLNDKRSYKFVLKDALDNTIWDADNVSIPAGGGSGPVSALTFVSGGSSGGGSVTKTITLPHKYKNAFGGFISFIVRSSSSGLTRTVNWEYTVAGSGISYEIGSGQTIVVNYETKVTMPFIVSSNTPFDQITIKFNGTSADTSIYDAAVYFYAEEVVEP